MFNFIGKNKFRQERQKIVPQPVANKLDRIKSLNALGVPISSVVDIGVQDATHDLISALPDKHHHLFEPVKLWHSKIKENYFLIMHTLHSVALGSENGNAWLIQSALKGDGIATHATISSKPARPDRQYIVDCEEIFVHQLDDYAHLFENNFLLKIDVDGKEIDILNGAKSCLKFASIIIIEADFSSLTQRGLLLEQSGFQLIDIIDRIMYGEVLWQCDLVYLRNDLMNETLRPPFFKPEAWRPLP